MSLPWVEKYRPFKREDLKGNTQSINSLYVFLKKWDVNTSNHGILLLGPPGCGKTSTVYALANELNFEVIEVNASDVRNKKSLKQRLSIVSRSIDYYNPRPRIILMDEVDGLSGNSDRGGLKELVAIIKNSMHPVVCTANDPNSDKITTLSKSLRILTFTRLDDFALFSLLEELADIEGVIIDDDELDNIVSNSQGDIRGAINDLESFSLGTHEHLSKRDKMHSMQDVLNNLFSSKSKEAARVSLSMAPSNYGYLISYIFDEAHKQCSTPKEIVSCYEQIALADLYQKRIIFNQDWKLLKYVFEYLGPGIFLSRPTKKFTRIVNLAPYPQSSKYIGMGNRKRSKLKSMAPTFSRKLHISQSKFIRGEHELIIKILSGSHGPEVAASLELDDNAIKYINNKNPSSQLIKKIGDARDRLQSILFQDSISDHMEKNEEEEPIDEEFTPSTIDDYF